MKKTIAIVIQVLIFVGAYFVMTPDTLEDNTYVFGLFGDVEVIKGNADWVMMTAGILSVINIWVWWPKKVKVTNTSNEAEDTKSAETDEAKDPIVPKMD